MDEEHNVDKERNPYRLKNSTWIPPKNREPALETYIQALDESLINMPVRRVRDNLTKSERTALRTLQRRIAQNEIVIKPADKGSATVVMSFDDYVKEAERQLGDARHYLPLHEDPTTAFTTNDVNRILFDMKTTTQSMNTRTNIFIRQTHDQPVFTCFPKFINQGIQGDPSFPPSKHQQREYHSS